jgi:deoxyribonuclease V
MDSSIPSHWLAPSNLEEAKQVQLHLANRLILEDFFPSPLHYIGGVDVSCNRFDPLKMIYSAAVVLDKEQLTVLNTSTIAQQQIFPYIPGFLGFREAPSLIEVVKRLDPKPDVLLVDGHGISHPRCLGIASHLGVLLDIPTIGVAKSILIGKLSGDLGSHLGDQVPLIWKGQQIGIALRSKPRSHPLIISSGHRISLQTAIDLVLACLKGYRLPEPTRLAHLAANACRRLYLTS